MSKELYAVLAEVSTYGAIATFTPYASISANVYPLPPPTTIVGALSYAYRRALEDFRELAESGCSPAIDLIEKKVLYAASGLVKPVVVSRTIEKLYQHIYLKKQHWKRPEMTYTIGVRPIAAVDRLQILFIVNGSDLVRYCYGITRLGRKESLVAVDDVVAVPVREALVKRGSCETTFYFPRGIAREYSPKGLWMEVDLPVLHRDNYSKKAVVSEPYVLPKPYSYAKATVELNENGAVLHMKTRDGGSVEVPVPRQAVEV